MHQPEHLKKAGLKSTLPRLKVLDLFENSEERHLSAEDVYKQLLNSGEDVGLATVYRVLTQFEQAGLLMRHHFEGGNKHSTLLEKFSLLKFLKRLLELFLRVHDNRAVPRHRLFQRFA